MKKKWRILLGVLLILALGLMALPGVSGYVSASHSTQAIQTLTDQVQEMDPQTLKLQRNLAQWYNLNLISAQPEAGYADAYDTILDLAGHAMGYIEIPAMDICLPIYHGVGEEALANGVGHLSQSAFPIGGTGNHTVLVGGDGLGGLEKLTEGDVFHISILGERITYSVEKTEPAPAETVSLDTEPGRDLCTLIFSGETGAGLRIQGVRSGEDE